MCALFFSLTGGFSVCHFIIFLCLGGAMIGVFAGGMGAPSMGPVRSGMSRLTCFNRT